LNIGPRKILDLAETLDAIDLTNKEDFYNTLKCCLLTKHEQEPIFNQLYHYYWFVRDNPNQKNNDKKGTVKREERAMRLPPSERKRLAEHLNTPEQRKDMRTEMRDTERRTRKDPYDDEDDNDTGKHEGAE